MKPCSERRRSLPALAVASCLVAALLAAAGPASAKVYLTVDEALDLAFEGCRVERTTVYLTDAEKERAEALAGSDVESAIVYPYVADCGGEPGGTAYFDAHRVRTLPETLMVVVSPRGEVTRVEILAFNEPEDYIPRDIWYQQFLDEDLDRELALGRSIRAVTGATLTARATTQAVRRVLALHQVVEERAAARKP